MFHKRKSCNLPGAVVLKVLSALLSSIASTPEHPLEFPRYDETDAHARTPEHERIVSFDPETEQDDLHEALHQPSTFT